MTTDSSEIIDACRVDQRKAELTTPEILNSTTQEYPESTIDAVLSLLGFQVWSQPSSLSEHAEKAEQLASGLYSVICITHAQSSATLQFNSSPNWPQIRKHRDAVFATCFESSAEFELLDHSSPDELFDAVEVGLEANGYLPADTPPRTTQFVSSLALHGDLATSNFE